MKRILFFSLILAFLLLPSCKNKQNSQQNNDTDIAMNMKTQPEFDIVTTMGTIRVRLYDKTPLHKANFIKLVEEHYYDSLLFHRVIQDFMIQTGDPYTRDESKSDMYGQGGPGYTVPAEFVNEYWHKKGALAAARKGDIANPRKASSGSQFYIVHNEDNCLHLDGQYTIFGETVDGFDVIDKIASVEVDSYDRPCEDVRIITIKPVLAREEPVAETDSLAAGDSTKIIVE